MKKIISVVGARPNFMKIAPIHRAFKKYSDSVQHLICHTGQHYDQKMSKVFFDELELPKPDFYLGVGSGSHAEQTARVMIEFENILLTEKPDLIIVVGDVNSTIACCLTAAKLNIRTVHVEAGLRSFDREMPEEINRILTDTISDLLFVTEQSGIDNLRNEGVSKNKVFLVGNVMIDSLIHFLAKTDSKTVLEKYKVEKDKYVLVTMHRPSNVDSPEQLIKIVDMLNVISKQTSVIFPVHPRTRKNLESFSLDKKILSSVILTDPIGYLDFINLIKNCSLVITDSGGIQEETTFLQIPCITTRTTTERPITVELGTNQLVGADFGIAQKAALEVLSGNKKHGNIPQLWDGKAAERITQIISDNLNNIRN
jgi:UDP-N-acetylglucosamine 2-epimerase (non-hydrolysing)